MREDTQHCFAMASHSANKPLTFSGKPKDKEYETCMSGLDHFFEKYKVDVCGRMATISSYLRFHFPRWGFVGFYTMTADGSQLQIGPYNGNLPVLACGTIAMGKGVCGSAVASRTVQIVEDVRKIENYISCDEDTLSELVLPVYGRTRHDQVESSARSSEGERVLLGVLDVDADIVGAFDEVDAHYLALICDKFL